MASQQLPCPKAFRILKKAHRASCPNEGFRAQLKLFEAMGCKIDNDFPECVRCALIFLVALILKDVCHNCCVTFR